MMESSAGVAERGQTVGGVERTRRRRRASRPLPPAPRRLDFADLLSNVRDHIALTKPRIIELLPKAEAFRVENAGHLGMIEKSDIFNGALDRLLARVRAELG